jgi:tRNA(Met) C34 N-acetyltransferase TmcA
MDTDYNLLPIAANAVSLRNVSDIDNVSFIIYKQSKEENLVSLQNSLLDRMPIGPLVAACKTSDQAKCVMAMVESISEKNSRNTVSITASRGRVCY